MPKKDQNIVILDDLDKLILEKLQVDSAITNLDLARHVHASAPTCLRRVRRLIDTGVITRQVAIIDPAKVNNSLTALIEITLDIQRSEEHTSELQSLMRISYAVF